MIKISNINDFLFCPFSIYFSDIYHENLDGKIFYTDKVFKGSCIHKNIDEHKYNEICGMSVFSEEYNLFGKIDVYNTKDKKIIERKTKIKELYEGYIYQLYSQYVCMVEMGFDVREISIYSFENNINYNIDLPHKNELKKLKNIINNIINFDENNFVGMNLQKCECCIYKNLCFHYQGD